MGIVGSLLSLETKTNLLIKILNILNKDSFFIKLKDLSDQFDVTISTMKRYLSELEEILPEGFEIETVSYKGVQLIKPSNRSILEVEQILIKETLTFKLLSAAFREQHDSVVNIAEELFISQPLLYKSIRNINQRLSKFHISISKRPFQLSGKESDIRNFYFQLINEAKSDVAMPDEVLRIVQDFITRLELELDNHLPAKTAQQIILLTIITIIRVQEKNDIGENISSETANPNVSVAVFCMIKEIREKLDLYVSREEYSWLTYVISKQLKEYPALVGSSNFIYGIEGLGHFVSQAEKIVEQSLTTNTQFLTLLHTQLVFEDTGTYMADYLDYEEGKLYSEVQRLYHSDFKKVSAFYNEFSNTHPMYKINTRKNIMEMLILLITLKRARKRIALLTAKGELWETFIRISLEEHLSGHFELVTVTEADLQHNMEGYCLLISDIEVEIGTLPVVVISDVPNPKDISNIRNQLASLQFNPHPNVVSFSYIQDTAYKH
ncbi:helix-turn-helix domain-containing protein [Listeria booriae]|uniref:helix-turn-helix domain-containing protein n=1 Tax=Listeria booriae TaxID=1552123 RepID=UPI0016262F28|nr:helix-turn-helix domain-containing protein [Listeria booriae]MBC2390814.1 HTH domain-containing protein [Listeria booriae]